MATGGVSASLPFSCSSANRVDAIPATNSWRNSQRQAGNVSIVKVSKGCSQVASRPVRGAVNIHTDSERQDDSTWSMRCANKSRREVLAIPAASICVHLLSVAFDTGVVTAAEFADMPALRGKDYGKSKMRYPDYVFTESGLQYKDLRQGAGPAPKADSAVVVDWDGYTIGYYGRIFEARNKAKGGSFEGNDKGYFRFQLGTAQVIPAFEEAVATMHVGGVRRIIVPPELGYPDNDFNRMGPKPTTFSGQRALDFVLRNQGLIDKTLLFDIELLKVADK